VANSQSRGLFSVENLNYDPIEIQSKLNELPMSPRNAQTYWKVMTSGLVIIVHGTNSLHNLGNSENSTFTCTRTHGPKKYATENCKNQNCNTNSLYSPFLVEGVAVSLCVYVTQIE